MKFIEGDVTLAVQEAILHGCNSKGVMGSGVALAIRERFPRAFSVYRRAFETTGLPLGSFTFVRCQDVLSEKSIEKIIVNLITQQDYGRDGKRYASPEAIQKSVVGFIEEYYWGLEEIVEIAISEIGSTLGGLDWKTDVEPILLEIEKAMRVEFVVYKK